MADTPTPQAPIAMVYVRNGVITMGSLYAPGLPDGAHELYCRPEAVAPYVRVKLQDEGKP